MSISEEMQKNLAPAYQSFTPAKMHFTQNQESFKLHEENNVSGNNVHIKLLFCLFLSLNSTLHSLEKLKLIPAFLSSYLQLWPLMSLLQFLNLLSGPWCHFLCYQFFPESCFLNKVTKGNTFTVLKQISKYSCSFLFFLSPRFSNLSVTETELSSKMPVHYTCGDGKM